MIQNKSWSQELESPAREAFEFLSEASFWRPNRIKLSGWIEHVPLVLWLVEALGPSSIVELGTYSGTSYAALCQAVRTPGLETRCYAIDAWKGDKQTGFYGDDIFADLATYNVSSIPDFRVLIRSTFDEAAQYFEDGSMICSTLTDAIPTNESDMTSSNGCPSCPHARFYCFTIPMFVREFGVFHL
jgi:hypothetical protein